MPEHVDEKTGKRLYHENETTLNIEKTVLSKFEPKSGKGKPSYMHREIDDDEPMDVERTLDEKQVQDLQKQLLKNWHFEDEDEDE